MHLRAFLLEKYSKDKKADNIIQFWQLGRKNIQRSAFLLQLVIISGVLLIAVYADATQGDTGFILNLPCPGDTGSIMYTIRLSKYNHKNSIYTGN